MEQADLNPKQEDDIRELLESDNSGTERNGWILERIA